MTMEKEWIELAIEKASTVKGVNVSKLTELTEDMGQLLLLQDVLSKSNIYFDIKLRKTAPSKSKVKGTPRTRKNPIKNTVPEKIKKLSKISETAKKTSTKKTPAKKTKKEVIDPEADFKNATGRKKRTTKAKK